MHINSANPQRRSIRLKDYDYSQPGSYFVTICTHGNENLFGNIVSVGEVTPHSVRAGSEPARTYIAHTDPARTNFPQFQSSNRDSAELVEMNLNIIGEIVLYTWKDLVNHNSGIKLGEFVIMPNHVHGIIHIVDPDTAWDDFIPSEFIFRNVEEDPVQAELVRAGSEPARTDIARTDASRANPAHTNHSSTDTAHTDPTHTNHQEQTPLSEIIRQFKTFSARRINQILKTPEIPVWQRNYYEHIIRNQESYDQIVEYIQNNPLNWKMDELFVD